MMTIGSAYAMSLETAIGSIEVGKDADFIVLTNDPLPLTAGQHLGNAAMVELFANEARQAAALQHPNLLFAIEIGDQHRHSYSCQNNNRIVQAHLVP